MRFEIYISVRNSCHLMEYYLQLFTVKTRINRQKKLRF
jgi:hypothetical protein